MTGAVGSRPVAVRLGKALQEPFQPAGLNAAPTLMPADGMQFRAVAFDGGGASAMHPAAGMPAYPDGFTAQARGAGYRDAPQLRRRGYKGALPKGPAMRRIGQYRHSDLYNGGWGGAPLSETWRNGPFGVSACAGAPGGTRSYAGGWTE